MSSKGRTDENSLSKPKARSRRRPFNQDQCVLRKLLGWLYADGKWETRREKMIKSQAEPDANLAPLLTSCVTLDESLSLPKPGSSSATWLTLPILQTIHED